jgi:hypothetical protein
VRSQQAPFGDPTKPQAVPIHRVRNEATEKELSNLPWCGGDFVQLTIIDGDVTCPDCLAIIALRPAKAGGPPVHFPGSLHKTLCMAEGDGQAFAKNLRDVTCEACLDQAERTLTAVTAVKVRIEAGGPAKLDEAFEKIVQVAGLRKDEAKYRAAVLERYDENTAALRDIGSTLETLLAPETQTGNLKTACGRAGVRPRMRPDPNVKGVTAAGSLFYTNENESEADNGV